MTNSEMDENQINKLILSKLTAEGADSGWMVALLLMQMMSILKVANHDQVKFQFTFAEYVHSLNETLKDMTRVLKEGQQ